MLRTTLIILLLLLRTILLILIWLQVLNSVCTYQLVSCKEDALLCSAELCFVPLTVAVLYWMSWSKGASLLPSLHTINTFLHTRSFSRPYHCSPKVVIYRFIVRDVYLAVRLPTSCLLYSCDGIRLNAPWWASSALLYWLNCDSATTAMRMKHLTGCAKPTVDIQWVQ